MLILLLMIGGMGSYIFVNQKKTKAIDPFADDANALIGIMPGMSQEDIQKRLNTVLDENMMNITINPNPIFEHGGDEGQLCIENIKANHFNYIVTIKLDDTQETVYTSGLIRPNHYVEKAVLDRPLEKGSYDATAYFEAFRDNKQRAGSSVVKMKIEVKH